MSYLEKYPKKAPNIVSRKIADEAILLPIRQNVGDLKNIYTLNEVGAFIWELIDGRRNVNEMVEAVREEFEVDPSTARNDIVNLMRELEELRIVKCSQLGQE